MEAKSKSKADLLRKMPYDEFLQTKYWKKFAKERLHKAGCQCSKCGRNDITLQVHHLTYERRGHELPSDVVVLCKACHLEIHGRPVPQYLIYNPVSLRDRAMAAIGK
jgi:5-methylcytosine-specific restriction endonuclease McrA